MAYYECISGNSFTEEETYTLAISVTASTAAQSNGMYIITANSTASLNYNSTVLKSVSTSISGWQNSISGTKTNSDTVVTGSISGIYSLYADSSAYASNSTRAIALSDSMSNYNYIIGTFRELDDGLTYSYKYDNLLFLVTPEKFAAVGTITTTITNTSVDNGYSSCIYTYTSDTVFTEKRGTGNGHSLYVYGIK